MCTYLMGISNKVKGKICCGGLVTRIVNALSLDLSSSMLVGGHLLHPVGTTQLLAMEIIEKGDDEPWLVFFPDEPWLVFFPDRKKGIV